jgi:hypothetical protein
MPRPGGIVSGGVGYEVTLTGVQVLVAGSSSTWDCSAQGWGECGLCGVWQGRAAVVVLARWRLWGIAVSHGLVMWQLSPQR